MLLYEDVRISFVAACLCTKVSRDCTCFANQISRGVLASGRRTSECSPIGTTLSIKNVMLSPTDVPEQQSASWMNQDWQENLRQRPQRDLLISVFQAAIWVVSRGGQRRELLRTVHSRTNTTFCWEQDTLRTRTCLSLIRNCYQWSGEYQLHKWTCHPHPKVCGKTLQQDNCIGLTIVCREVWLALASYARFFPPFCVRGLITTISCSIRLSVSDPGSSLTSGPHCTLGYECTGH